MTSIEETLNRTQTNYGALSACCLSSMIQPEYKALGKNEQREANIERNSGQ